MKHSDRILELSKIVDAGCSPYYDMLPNLIRERQYAKGIEIGVLFGGHAKAILESDSVELLIGIDPYKLYEQEVMGIETQEDFDEVYYFAMDRLDDHRFVHMEMTSNDAFPLIEDWGWRFDFIFIDGLHTYDQVKWELEHYSKLIRRGGVIACHDYNHPSFPLLTKAIDEFAEAHDSKVIQGEFHAIYIEKTW